MSVSPVTSDNLEILPQEEEEVKTPRLTWGENGVTIISVSNNLLERIRVIENELELEPQPEITLLPLGKWKEGDLTTLGCCKNLLNRIQTIEEKLGFPRSERLENTLSPIIGTKGGVTISKFLEQSLNHVEKCEQLNNKGLFSYSFK